MAMMDHEKLGELLSAYLDNAVDAHERQQVEALLREDATARRLLAELRSTVNLVSSLPRHAAPASIAADLQSRLEREALLGDTGVADVSSGFNKSRRWLARLSIAAMVVFTGLGLYWFSIQWLSTRIEHVARSAGGNAESVEPGSRDSAKGLSMTSADRGEVRLLRPPLDVQLATGASRESVVHHTFASEPVVMQIASDSGKDRVAVESALTVALRSEDVSEFRITSVKSTGLAVSSDAVFFVSGKAGVNFDSPDQQQILVRAPRSKVDAMLASLTSVETSGWDVHLRAGDVSAQGLMSSRRVLQIVQPTVANASAEGLTAARTRLHSTGSGDRVRPASEAPARAISNLAPETSDAEKVVATKSASKKSEASSGEYSGGFLKLFGLDPDLLAALEPTKVADASRSHGDERAVSPAPPSSVPPAEPSGLVNRSLTRIESETVKRKSEGGESAATLSKPGTQGETGNAVADDPIITLVVQIVPSIAAPASAAPGAGKPKPETPSLRSKSSSK